MKTTLPYIITLLLLAGCITDHKSGYDPDMEMLFHPVMQVAVKSHHSMEDYPVGQPFAVNVWTLEEGESWGDNSDDAELYHSGEPTYMIDTDRWVLPYDKHWPERSKKVTVIGYSPVSSFNSCTSSDGASCIYNMRHDQADLLYTEPQEDLDKVECGGTVIMPFRHALSQVDFKVKNRVRGDEEIIIKSIRIDGVKCCGHFTSLPTPTWVLENEEMELSFFMGHQTTVNNPVEIGHTWNIIPQALSTKVTVEYEYRTSADTGFSLVLKTCDLRTDLKPGRHYTYTLAIGIDEVQFLLEIIEDRFKSQDIPDKDDENEDSEE